MSDTPGLRSDAWLGGDDEVALNHRAALRAAGWRRAGSRPGRSRRPLIGIACTASDLNRCDRGLTTLARAVRRGVLAAGGLPLEFPVMSLSEDLMKPTAMLYRADAGPGGGGRGSCGAGCSRRGARPFRTYGCWGLARGIVGPDLRWPVGKPVTSLPAFMVVHGNLAPSGAVIKAAAASPSLLRHRGPAVVFHSYEEMRRRIDDPSLDVTPSSVLVLAGCGPAGMAMPEWGNIPIPSRLLGQGVTDMLRITDGRMSGTGFGTVVLHVAPESAVGGPLSRLRDGDIVSLDAYAGSLSVEADLASREPVVPAVSDRRGWPVLHRMHVLQAPEGCDYDFLRAETPEQLAFIEPVIGRS